MNKKKRNILLVSLCAVLVIGVCGAFAWLQDVTQTETNSFTSSHVDITLTETATDFKMIPGEDITKDPIITVEGSADAVDCWVFFKQEKGTTVDDYLTWSIAEGWTAVQNVDGVWAREVSGSTDDQAFSILDNNKVTVKSTVTNTMMDDVSGVSLKYTAYAIQKKGFATAEEAWNEVKDNTTQYTAK